MKKVKMLLGIVLVVIAFSAPLAIASPPDPGGSWKKLWHPLWGWDCSGIPDGCYVLDPPPV